MDTSALHYQLKIWTSSATYSIRVNTLYATEKLEGVPVLTVGLVETTNHNRVRGIKTVSTELAN